MNVNIEDFNKENLNKLIEEDRAKEWDLVYQSKLQDIPEEDVAILKTFWSHGFMTGAVSACKMSEGLYTQLKG